MRRTESVLVTAVGRPRVPLRTRSGSPDATPMSGPHDGLIRKAGSRFTGDCTQQANRPLHPLCRRFVMESNPLSPASVSRCPRWRATRSPGPWWSLATWRTRSSPPAHVLTRRVPAPLLVPPAVGDARSVHLPQAATTHHLLRPHHRHLPSLRHLRALLPGGRLRRRAAASPAAAGHPRKSGPETSLRFVQDAPPPWSDGR